MVCHPVKYHLALQECRYCWQLPYSIFYKRFPLEFHNKLMKKHLFFKSTHHYHTYSYVDLQFHKTVYKHHLNTFPFLDIQYHQELPYFLDIQHSHHYKTTPVHRLRIEHPYISHLFPNTDNYHNMESFYH